MATLSITELVKKARRRRVFRVIALYIVGAWGALQIADLVFPGIDVQESAIRYVWIAAALGFPIALFVGWRYDIVGGKVVRTIDGPTDAKPAIGRSDYIILSALSFVIAVIAIQMVLEISAKRVTGSPQITAARIDPNSVAVLPFMNLSGSPDNEYLSDGVTETLLHTISQLPGLKVAARTSSFYFKGRDVDIREIAMQLGVAYVLEGSVQRSGDKLRVVAQLIDADTGFHRWSTTYDREMNDIFAIQDDIANNVAHAMQVTLSDTVRPGAVEIETVSTQNVAAYEMYLRGMQQKDKGGYKDLALAELSFKEALTLDPGFFEARLHLAFTYFDQANTRTIDPAEAYARLNRLVGQLRDEGRENGLVSVLSANTDFMRATVLGEGELDVDRHLSQLSAEIDRTPNEPQLYGTLIRILFSAGRRDEALIWADRGLVVDPLDWHLYFWRALLLRYDGDLAGAEAAFETASGLNPENPNIPANAATVAWEQKEYVQWFALTRKAMDLDPLDPMLPGVISDILRRFGLTEEAVKYSQRVSAITGEPHALVAMLQQLLAQNDYAQASKRSADLLRDPGDARSDQYSWAAIVFMSAMVELGETAKALSVLEELVPGVTSPDFQPRNDKQLILQYVAVLGLAESQSNEETQRLLSEVVPRWTEMGTNFLQRGFREIPIEWARGNRTGAIELALDSLDTNPDPAVFRHVYFWKPAAQEPAVMARLVEIEAAFSKAGEEVREYIVANDLHL